MHNYVDITIGLIFLLMIIEGYIRGLVRSIVGLLGYIFAFLVAKFYYLPVTNLLKENFEWFRALKPKIMENFIAHFRGGIPGTDASFSGKGNIQEFFQKGGFLKNKSFSEGLAKSIDQLAKGTDTAQVGGDIVEKSASFVADGIVNGIGFLLVVLLCLLVVKLLGVILDIATEVPLIKQANKLGGVIFGVVKATVFVFVLMLVAMFIGPLFPNLKVAKAIFDSQIGVYFYENNILLVLLHRLLGL